MAGQTFPNLQANLRGSFLYVSALNTPTIEIILKNSIFKCIGNDFCIDQARFALVYNNLNSSTPTLIGGLIHIDYGVIGTITSTNNQYRQCYTTREGSAFYLPTNVKLTDTSSKYYGLAGLKGVIYCYQCQVA